MIFPDGSFTFVSLQEDAAINKKTVLKLKKEKMNTVVNSVRLLGNLGKDPVVRTFSNGGKVANCTLATAHISKDKDGNKVEEADWHNLVIRGKIADVAEKYLSKGSQIAVEGTLRYRKYSDQDGTEKYITEIIVHDLQMIGGKKDK